MDSSSTTSSTNTATSTVAPVLTPRWERPHDGNDGWSESSRSRSRASASSSFLSQQPPIPEPLQSAHDMEETTQISQDQCPSSVQRNTDQQSNLDNPTIKNNDFDEGLHLTPERSRHYSDLKTGSSYTSIISIGGTRESEGENDVDADDDVEKDGGDDEGKDEIQMNVKAKSLQNWKRKPKKYYTSDWSTLKKAGREVSSPEGKTEVSTATPAGNARADVVDNSSPSTTQISKTYHLPPPPSMAVTATVISQVPGAFRMRLRYLNELDEEVDSTADESQLQQPASPTQPQRRRAQQVQMQIEGHSTEPPLLIPHASVVESRDSCEPHGPDATMLVLGEPQPWYLKRRAYLRVLFGTSALAVVAVVTLTIILVSINVDGNSKRTASNVPTNTTISVPTQAPTPLARGGILWQEIASVQGVKGGDKLGWSVAAVMDTTNISNMSDSRGFYWVTGAPFCDAGGGMSDVGCVYAFQVSSERGANTSAIGSSIPQNLPISTRIQSDVASSTLGWSVAMASVNGSLIVATGAPQNSIYGYVRVYQYNPANASPWTQMGQDLLGDSLPGNFGTNVALSANGRILAVASDEYSQGSAGHFGGLVQVYCYDCTRSTNIPRWSLMGSSLFGNGTSELFGYSIALSSSGNILAVGSIGYSSTGSVQGIVEVFSYQNNDWHVLGNSLTGPIAQFLLGSSVALSSDGKILAVGAVGGANNAGLIRVYRYDESSNKWIQMGTDLIGSSQYDFFGTAVSLSANGTVLAATADQHWHTGSRKGYARVYKYTNESDWQQLGQDLLGRETGEQMGQSIVLTADGNNVIVGAPYPTSMNESGSVFVFQATPVDIKFLALLRFSITAAFHVMICKLRDTAIPVDYKALARPTSRQETRSLRSMGLIKWERLRPSKHVVSHRTRQNMIGQKEDKRLNHVPCLRFCQL